DDYERFLRDKVKKAQAAGGGLGKARGVHLRQVKIFSMTSESADQGTEARGSEVVELVSQLMAEGVEKGASDIHIDHESHGVIVRFRVDGVLHTREKLIPLSFSKPLVARIKVIANMDPTERMHPQDGRISITYREHDYDFRVATIPVKRGERVTLRLLDSGGSLIDINKLVLAPALAKIIQAMIHKPQGIVLVTGPTGSGKTTTLYSLIKERLQAQNAINIVTAEDPVEYTLPGVAQVEVNEHRGLTFPMVLRSFLRHDPDVILIGETRDPETARISVQAALTGHLVVTSLHTNSALDSLVRLKDLGIEDYLLGSAITGIIAQRLVRHICPVCAAPAELSQAVKDALTRVGVLKNGEEMVAKKGSGCDQCGGTGYKGRVGIYEVFSPTDSTRALISHGASQDEIKADAQRNGMVMLNQYAALLLKNGITTASEVLRVLDS
ncbi:type II/IV secretion system protein, partial [Myxococcota bacterium]|nr:type II/IV secretion system protein [Myxococcota bacterium]